jgi:hypothetical protein
MKVIQIVSEHKKGVRAMKYTKKTKSTVPVYGPEANDAKLKPVKPTGAVKETAIPGQMVGKVSKVDPATGKVDVQSPTGQTTTVNATQLSPGDNNKLSMEVPNVQPGMEVDAAKVQEEQPGIDPQMSGLQQLLATAQQPWEQAQIKWRMDNLKSQQSLAGEPGGGNGAPVDARGNLIPVLPTQQWMAKNPSILKQLPNEALPPQMQRPGMLDRMKSLAGIK